MPGIRGSKLTDEPELVTVLKKAMADAIAAGSSLRDLSRRSGVHSASVARFYKGDRDLTAVSFGHMAKALGLTLVAVKRKGK